MKNWWNVKNHPEQTVMPLHEVDQVASEHTFEAESLAAQHKERHSMLPWWHLNLLHVKWSLAIMKVIPHVTGGTACSGSVRHITTARSLCYRFSPLNLTMENDDKVQKKYLTLHNIVAYEDEVQVWTKLFTTTYQEVSRRRRRDSRQGVWKPPWKNKKKTTLAHFNYRLKWTERLQRGQQALTHNFKTTLWLQQIPARSCRSWHW